MEPMVGDQSIQLLMAQIDARFALMEVRLQRFILGTAGLLLAAIGIATGVLIALN